MKEVGESVSRHLPITPVPLIHEITVFESNMHEERSPLSEFKITAWAFTHPQVNRVIAETLPELTPSIRVLEKNRFVNIGEGSESGVIRFELPRAVFEG
ncbi:MAG: GNAT family N-acetyltransferase [Kastovskya adunca ATA6-11-RM4]|jgi:hypothetical protein|nr:GNAT family N-acetyltransferase [Kastovskya adunca ATA6-11-RM4]